jgi:hypothetical protein
VFVLVAIGLVIAYYVQGQAAEARKHRETEAKYRESLSEAEGNYRRMLEILRSNPNDPALREKALGWGRRFAELTRQPIGSGVTIYDEVALSNDINAACAGANRANGSAELRESSLEDRLERLKGLLDKGLISSDEYSEKRKRLLDEI